MMSKIPRIVRVIFFNHPVLKLAYKMSFRETRGNYVTHKPNCTFFTSKGKCKKKNPLP